MSSIAPTSSSSSSSSITSSTTSSSSSRPMYHVIRHLSNSNSQDSVSESLTDILRQTAHRRMTHATLSTQSASSILSSASVALTSSNTGLASISLPVQQRSSSSNSSSSSMNDALHRRKRKTPEDSEEKTNEKESITSSSSHDLDCKQAPTSSSSSSSSSSSTSSTSDENLQKRIRLSSVNQDKDTKAVGPQTNETVVEGFNEDCPICQTHIDTSKEAISKLACKHIYHLACLAPWLAKSNDCPMCRGEIIPNTNRVAQNSISVSSSSSSSQHANQTAAVRNVRANNISVIVSSGEHGRITQTITYTNTNPTSAINDGPRDEAGYRVYRDGSCDSIDHNAENVRLINYTVSQVDLNSGNVIIEGTSRVANVDTNGGNITIRGPALVTQASTNGGNITLSGTAHVGFASVNGGSIILQDNSIVDRADGQIRDLRPHPRTSATESQPSFLERITNNLTTTTLESTNVQLQRIASNAFSHDQAPEETIGSDQGLSVIGLYYAHSRSVRVKAGSHIGTLIFPEAVGRGTVTVEIGAHVSTIINGDRAASHYDP